MASVLIVDDDGDIASLLEVLLTSKGHEVSIAYDGRQALDLMKKGLPDLVISDAEMPVLDARGLAYRMFYEDCGRELIPIVLISGSPEIKEIAKQIGTPYVLAKPFSIDAITELAERALEERRQFQPNP
jgi:DNA-binding NtrC family response regulator